MVQIYQDQPSFASRLAGAGINAAGEFGKAFMGKKLEQRKKQELARQSDLENEQIKANYGIDLSGIQDPKSRQLILSEKLKGQTQKKDLGSTFTSILDEMEGLKSSVGPLKIQALNPYSETSGTRSKINTLRLSLEGLFRDLTLKGQFPKAIYERILKELPSASDTEKQYTNKIEAVRKILSSHYEDDSKSQREQEKVFHMIDDQGNEYDIPSNLYEKAAAKGLRKK